MRIPMAECDIGFIYKFDNNKAYFILETDSSASLITGQKKTTFKRFKELYPFNYKSERVRCIKRH